MFKKLKESVFKEFKVIWMNREKILVKKGIKKNRINWKF